MEGARQRAQNTRRMDPTRNGNTCRLCLNRSCRLGPRCNYRQEWPVIPSSRICRYFQKGGCWFGDQCKYFHVLQPEVVTAAAGRRGSVPAVSSSSVAFASPDRRGSEPALLQTEGDGQRSRQECRRSQPVVRASNSQNAGHLTASIAEEPSQETDSESVQSSRVAQAAACHGSKEEESPSSVDGAAAAATAAASGVQVEETEAFLRSKNLSCGICMDKVYEKHARQQVFGILPNCNHSFCLECIMTWRKTKDLGPEVVKSCPQCRVKSPFYVPNKYWVEGQEKESVIAAFKEKYSSKNCNYYSRYGCCPFKTDCLYRHNKPAHRHTSSRRRTEAADDDDEDLADLRNFVIAVTLLGDDDDFFDFLFTD